MKQVRIIGVRYIGKQEVEEDPLLKSGVQWRQGQVVNFSLPLAEKLFAKHFDMFEEAQVDYNANTVLSVPNAANAQPVVSVNLNSMSAAQQRMFARIEYSRTLSENMSDEEVRRAVIAMMLDAEENTLQSENERFALSYPVSADEYAAIMQGVVELRLVPVAAPAESTEPASTEVPTLEETLEAMDADALRAFAAEHEIKVHHAAGAEKLRESIAAALKASEQQWTEQHANDQAPEVSPAASPVTEDAAP